MAIVLALIVFLLLGALAQAAGVLGIWLAIVILPAYFRYLLYLLEARAAGHNAPTPGIELFDWVGNFWSLFPLVFLSLLGWGTWLLATEWSAVAAWSFGVLMALVFPASMAILAVTRSPLESLNPAALAVLIRNCGRDYLLIPAVIVTMALLIWLLVFLEAPTLLANAFEIYATCLMFTMTGAVMRANATGIEVDLPPQRQPDTAALDATLSDARAAVLNHAYGFISHDNRTGGLQCLYDWIDREADTGAAYQWFFEQMLKWEPNEAALFFAQRYLSWLLGEGRDVQALKLIARCRLEDPRFKPLPENRSAALAAAKRQHNDELREYLRR